MLRRIPAYTDPVAGAIRAALTTALDIHRRESSAALSVECECRLGTFASTRHSYTHALPTHTSTPAVLDGSFTFFSGVARPTFVSLHRALREAGAIVPPRSSVVFSAHSSGHDRLVYAMNDTCNGGRLAAALCKERVANVDVRCPMWAADFRVSVARERRLNFGPAEFAEFVPKLSRLRQRKSVRVCPMISMDLAMVRTVMDHSRFAHPWSTELRVPFISAPQISYDVELEFDIPALHRAVKRTRMLDATVERATADALALLQFVAVKREGADRDSPPFILSPLSAPRRHVAVMLWRLLAGGSIGAVLSACMSSEASLAASAPTLDLIMDPTKDIVPVRGVVVGGGYAGSKLAYMFDSVLDVTIIDEKNFYELTNDIIPIIANPWTERNEEACRRLLILHRYYLKRANILTGTVDGVDEDAVTLRDGRRVPYDLLFVAPGERKPFPFGTKQRTISGRVQELRHFNEFLGTCRKVAVVGGGPVGTSLAFDLAANRPELDVHLYHSKAEVLPALPTTSRRYAMDALQRHKNLTTHFCTHVTGIEGCDANGKRIDPTPQSFFSRFFFRSTPTLPSRFTVQYDKMHFVPAPPQSIVSQAYFGRREPHLSGDTVESSGAEEDFDFVFVTSGDTPRPIRAGRGKPNILAEHETPDGHYRVSTLMQLYGHPNIWAPGRCNNLPWVRSYGSSDVQVRTLFRGLNSVVHNPTERFLHSRDGVQPQRMAIPRLLVRLGNNDAVGATPWSGGMVGLSAFHEFMQDRNHLVKEYQQPIFYKQQDPMKVKQRISNWAAHEVTDIVDFSHC